MKKSHIVFALCLLLMAMYADGQEITNVSVTPDKPSYNGGCPAKITFTAVIRYTGTGSIQYTWLRSDGAKAPTRTLQLKAGGTATVTTSWQLGKSFSGWQALKIISPENYESSHAAFTIACNGVAPKNNNNTVVANPQKNNGTVTAANTGIIKNNAALQVKSVDITADKPSYTGTCPVSIGFKATVHSTGSGIIRYTWVTSDGGHNPVINKKLNGSGTDELLPYNWKLARTFSGSASLKIIAPVQFQSQNASFSVNCSAASKASAISGQVKQPATNHPPIKKPVVGAAGQPKKLN